MHIKDTIINYLYDKDYFISIYDNHIYVFKYNKLLKINDNEVIFKMNKFNLVIKGNNLFLKKMLKDEVLVSGNIINVGIDYE